jgi:hypothetical protein
VPGTVFWGLENKEVTIHFVIRIGYLGQERLTINYREMATESIITSIKLNSYTTVPGTAKEEKKWTNKF